MQELQPVLFVVYYHQYRYCVAMVGGTSHASVREQVVKPEYEVIFEIKQRPDQPFFVLLSELVRECRVRAIVPMLPQEYIARSEPLVAGANCAWLTPAAP